MKAMSNREFGKFVMGLEKSAEAFRPGAVYYPDGDCIEFLMKPDSFYAERIDDMVTVYYSQETKKIIGSLIKGVTEFYEKILKTWPGFAIEIRDGRVRLAHLFRAHLWSEPLASNAVIVQVYEKLLEDAESIEAEVEVSKA